STLMRSSAASDVYKRQLYMNLDLKNLTNLQLIYIFTLGLVGIAILSWLSYICLSNSKKYTHCLLYTSDAADHRI
ncbi:hypothetical protein ELP45_28990, partial [Klebsiella pneumoniae]|nr:hypothetical protein [Klebsiella pneumoniae]